MMVENYIAEVPWLV